ncbi:MAG: acyl-CoA dehydrogenase family protein [Steroidobacteraceae bacterium]|jgi:acyl-CoA dehydrogenase
MDFSYSDKVQGLQRQLTAFMETHVYPAERRFEEEIERNRRAGNPWQPTAVMEELKKAARAEALWNLFLPDSAHGAGLTNLEYAPLCEIMGRSPLAPEACNCSAPDTGNMEVLARYGSPEQQRRWLVPLLEGRIRSAFAMTEPDVASSDATNIRSSIVREGSHFVVNGRKWWTSGAGDPRCEILIFMGQTDPAAAPHRRQSMILVPMATPGVKRLRQLSVFGYDHAPHGHAEVEFTDVRVPAENLLLGEGRGFEIAQGRLGPGRIHHCMRLIGVAERALESLCRRADERVAFGRRLSEQGVTLERIAESRILIDQARWLVLNAAYRMDTVGNREAKQEIAMIKVAAPEMACRVIDWAIQLHGGGGVSDDFPLAAAYAAARTLRLADGPDEVHRQQIGKLELARHRPRGAQGESRTRAE